MARSRTTKMTESADGLPRRRAIQGIAGSLAGLAALGAVNASAKKKGKKGRLVKFDTAKETGTIPSATPTTITVTCPAAGKMEQVFATGGGYAADQDALTMFATTSQPTGDGQGWEVSFVNAAAPQDVSVSVVCAYFKTK